MASLLQDEATLIELAAVLGITNWQLAEGTYNGCGFHTLQPLSAAISQSEVANTLATGVYTYNKILGQNLLGGNPNGRTNLFLTTLALTGINDSLNNKLIRKKLPYTNGDNIEEQGLSGWSFSINTIFIGPDYLTAINNFLAAVVSAPPELEHVLVHPIYGQIEGDVYFSHVTLRYNSDAFQAAIVELHFEAEQALAWIPTPLSITQIASQALTAIIGAVGAVGSAVSLGKFIAS